LIVTVNGEAREVREEMTLLELLHELELRPEQVAVERNLHVVPRKEFAGLVLHEGDLLEIVTLVGGGQ
jgi:sulfur carrier protein